MAGAAAFLPIEDYFIIGDLRTAALVSRQGSIDWLCLPYFDSPSIFGKLLDPAAGCLAIDMPDYKIDGEYITDTAIVEFNLTRGGSKLSIKDFMVPQPKKTEVSQQLVREISGSFGKAAAVFKFQPKADYGSSVPEIKVTKSQLKFSSGQGSISLRLPDAAKATEHSGYYLISVPIDAGQTKQLVLEYTPKAIRAAAAKEKLEDKTLIFWRRWVGKGNYFGFCRDDLVRSAITLKLMQFYPTGALVAAPTTSLPEEIGGPRNWDYRYVWIRDATFALYSFYVLGYDQEARHFFDFIEKVTERCAKDSFDVSLMYTIWGDPVPEEQHIDRLAGYKHSQPVRVGNDASRQFQLDVYGALIDAFYFVSKRKITDLDKTKWRGLVMQLVRKIDGSWQKPDHGIWEARVGTKHYTYSKVMSWVGADRANRLKDALSLSDKDLAVCSRLEDSISQWIWQNCFKDGKLTQHPETAGLDATNFLFVLLQFLDKHEPRTKRIVDDTAKALAYKKTFVYRYHNPDGLAGKEGAFILCSFWLVSALAILEEVETALTIFRRLEKYIGPHGLLSEEIDPETKAYLGNYPQAFSHQGFIMSAYYIDKYAKRQNLKF